LGLGYAPGFAFRVTRWGSGGGGAAELEAIFTGPRLFITYPHEPNLAIGFF
jgi:hypothetical protein